MFQLVEDICKDDNLEELAKQVDVIFTATPQGFLAGLLTEEILSQVKIVDPYQFSSGITGCSDDSYSDHFSTSLVYVIVFYFCRRHTCVNELLLSPPYLCQRIASQQAAHAIL